METVDGIAALLAFGAAVGVMRLFVRDTCDDHRTVYVGNVRVIDWTLWKWDKKKPDIDEFFRLHGDLSRWFLFINYRMTTVLNFQAILKILCLSRGQNR